MIQLPHFLTARLKRWGLYVPPYHYTYRSLLKAFYFYEVYQHIQNVEGAIVECGVGYGNSIVILASLNAIEGKNRHITGFDSFEGFPNTDEDYSRAAHFKKAHIRRVQKRIAFARVPSQVKLVKGFFEGTLDRYHEPIAFLHIDVDIASSYTTVLEKIFDRVVKGGVILFDEYKNPHWEGATKAIDAFLAGRYEIQRCTSNDKYYIIK